MRSNKQRAIIYCRKRGISLGSVKAVFKMMSIIPSYKDSPSRRRSPYIGPDGNTYHEWIKQDTRKNRDMTDDQLQEFYTRVLHDDTWGFIRSA